jgi:inositol phosphorylceramide mannosyltransferase catalytic subunit
MAASLESLKERLFFRRCDFSADFAERVQNLERWEWLAERFERNESAAAPKKRPIPKIIHQIWVGGRLPVAYRRWTDSWRTLNPSWEYRLWDEKSILAFGLRNEEAFRKSASPGVKSDLARYEILERMGGIYADTDFECLAPCEQISRDATFFAALIFGPSPVVSNGLLGFAPGHPLLSEVIAGIGAPVRTRDGMKILSLTGPGYFTEAVFRLKDRLPASDIIYPSSYFFPVPNFIEKNSITNAQKRSMIREWSVAIHYWETSWLKPSRMRKFLSRGKQAALRLVRAGSAVRGSRTDSR